LSFETAPAPAWLPNVLGRGHRRAPLDGEGPMLARKEIRQFDKNDILRALAGVLCLVLASALLFGAS
jgi:hypothetical protein